MMMTEVDAISEATLVYSRFGKVTDFPTEACTQLEQLAGNPTGMGISTIPYIYCISSKTRRGIPCKQLFYLEIQWSWPPHSKIFDETALKHQKNMKTYEAYNQMKYVGVIRKFADMNRFVLFHPSKYVTSVRDVDKDMILYKKGATYTMYDSLQADDSQRRLVSLMNKYIGMDFIDEVRDYFCISEIARRRHLNILTLERQLSQIICRIKVNKSSGCWVSTNRNDYKRTFWLSLGGIDLQDIFYFPSEISPEQKPMFVKNKNILHSLLCELSLGKRHARCCRPLHLRLGTSAENAVHIKIRKNIEQLFDLSPSELKDYTQHLTGIASIMMKQQQTLTRNEEKLRTKNKRQQNRVMFWQDLETHQKGCHIIGNPNLGDCGDKYLVIKEEGDGEDKEEEKEEEEEEEEEAEEVDINIKPLFQLQKLIEKNDLSQE